MSYYCIGEKLGHSYSVEIHRMLGNSDYTLKEIPPDELEAFILSKEYSGLNVTIPYKQKVMPYLDHIDPDALAIGCVNTIVNKSGKLYGYNTDFAGMSDLTDRIGVSLEGKTAAVLGTGGTSKTARAVARHRGSADILVVSRHPGEGEISYEELNEKAGNVDVIINTTPVGMYPNEDAAPVDINAFPALCGVIDAVYHPLKTRLVSSALEKSIPASGGLYMLVSQAVRASEYFLEKKYTREDTDRVYAEILSSKRNIVLIGMPGSGKSTVGRIIAEKLSKAHFDSDDIFTRRFGTAISDYFAENGEAAFRREESKIIKELSAEYGAVISTGGGVILDRTNMDALSGNGVIVFIDRPLEKLAGYKGRPLTPDRDSMKKKYDERYGLYRSYADIVIKVTGSAAQTADKIIEQTEKTP